MDPGKEPRVKRQRYRVSPSKVPSRYTSEVHGLLHRTGQCSCGWNKRLGREDSEVGHKRYLKSNSVKG